MVNPIYLLAVPFLTAFILPLFYKMGRRPAQVVFTLLLLFMAALPVQILISLIQGADPVLVETAGVPAPFSISLLFGTSETFVLAGANLIALLSGLLMAGRLSKSSAHGMMLFAILTLAVDGLIVTRDIFNMFVFMEIAAISTYGLIGLDKRALEAGFKYALAGGIASLFYLIGTIYVYRVTGSLNIDAIIAAGGISPTILGGLAGFFIVVSLLIELKSFPANGWALDVYQTAPPALAAVISGGSAGAMLFAIYKIMPIIPENLLAVLSGVGLVSFAFSNFLALNQTDSRRMLGYSSVGYIGLILFVIAQSRTNSNLGGFAVAGALFINHMLAKAGLFWFAGRQADPDRRRWKLNSGLQKVIFGVLITALAGFPPFPAFWGKWALIMEIAGDGAYWTMGILLLGSLFEAAYLFRWFGDTLKNESTTPAPKGSRAGSSPSLIAAALLAGIGLYSGYYLDVLSFVHLFFIAGALLLFLIDWLPGRIKAIIAVAVVGFGFTGFDVSITSIAELSLQQMFIGFFLLGWIIHILASMYRKKDKRPGFYPLNVILIFSLMQIVAAQTALDFFLAWELMALSSYFLVLKGRESTKAAQRYLVFSTASAFFLLAGFALNGGSHIIGNSISSMTVLILFVIGLMIKTGVLGFHIWLPGSYAEAEDDTSSFFSSVLSKITIFALLGVLAGSVQMLTAGGHEQGTGFDITVILSWVGVLTAFGGTLIAVFQEDIKKTLAYSSMGQLGYIIMAVALANHFGWTTAIYLTLNHFIFKVLLWLAIAGIIHKTGKRLMYQMGGLIKTMPVTFISVLMAIIALSGVPPLSGFGSKWLMYTGLIEKGWIFQAVVVFFSSTIAFLYLFRLIHAIFLGQPKDPDRKIKEAPLWLLIPQVLMMMLLMGFSMKPQWVIQPIQSAVSAYFPQTAFWDGPVFQSSLGYWSGEWVMYMTMGIFIFALIWLMVVMRKPQYVKQFNIVFSAERPDKPETTHYAYNFFGHYRKALGFLVRPKVEGFWKWVREAVEAVSSAMRRIYSGNGQTYILHIVMFVIILFFIGGVK